MTVVKIYGKDYKYLEVIGWKIPLIECPMYIRAHFLFPVSVCQLAVNNTLL